MKKLYWGIGIFLLLVITGTTFKVIQDQRELAELKRNAAIADELLHGLIEKKAKEQNISIHSHDQPTNQTEKLTLQPAQINTDILENTNSSDTIISTEITEQAERPLGLDPIDYDSIPGIPTLEELTTTYKLRMLVDPDGAESRTTDIPRRSDYDTYEEYVKANTALMKYSRHRAKKYLEMTNSNNQ